MKCTADKKWLIQQPSYVKDGSGCANGDKPPMPCFHAAVERGNIHDLVKETWKLTNLEFWRKVPAVMRRLDVSPLPCFDATEEPCPQRRADEGFVEDSVVVALLTAPCRSGGWETWPGMPELAGALDYAGWPSTGTATMRRAGA